MLLLLQVCLYCLKNKDGHTAWAVLWKPTQIVTSHHYALAFFMFFLMKVETSIKTTTYNKLSLANVPYWIKSPEKLFVQNEFSNYLKVCFWYFIQTICTWYLNSHATLCVQTDASSATIVSHGSKRYLPSMHWKDCHFATFLLPHHILGIHGARTRLATNWLPC